MGSYLDGSSYTLGICLAIYVPQIILWGISGSVLGLGGWASGPSKVMLCVIWPKGRKTSSANTSKNSSNKAEIYGSLAPRARGV